MESKRRVATPELTSCVEGDDLKTDNNSSQVLILVAEIFLKSQMGLAQWLDLSFTVFTVRLSL